MQNTIIPSPPFNHDFVSMLDKLETLMKLKGEVFRARAYKKAQETILSITEPISSAEQVRSLPGIGSAIFDKLKEFETTGTLSVLEKEKNNPIYIFSDIYGVGPKKAKELVDKGITNLSLLREKQDILLNDVQKKGLRYYDDILQPIPRSEIQSFHELFIQQLGLVAGKSGTYLEIVGSYRRGAAVSGDIDVILTSPSPEAYIRLVDSLIQKKIILEVLSRGEKKTLVIAKLTPSSVARRIDFLYTDAIEYPFSLLYFTGSKAFNTVMRHEALQLGYSMNEHGMSKINSAGVNLGLIQNVAFREEKDIFDFLGLVYKAPTERIDGRAVEKKNNNTLDPIPVITNIEQFQKRGLAFLKTKTEQELHSMLQWAKQTYYNGEVAGMGGELVDAQYDILENYVIKRGGVGVGVGVGVGIEKNKVLLPFEMASMDKIKPDTDALLHWTQKFSGPYVLSCKLDGVSGLYTTQGTEPKLYTRGDGTWGQDVSHFIPYLHLPTLPNIVIRGEFIMPKKVFEQKYKNAFANPRNMVSGIINRHSIDEKISDIHFVGYEVIVPSLKPSMQLSFLKNNDIRTVPFMTTNCGTMTNKLLSDVLLDWRKNDLYEIDGIIVTNDEIYPRKKGNPEHSFAFKMVLSEQIAEATVVDVLWTASKDGYLKPRIQIEPLQLAGVKIEYATGFNAQFIQLHKIGVGAVVQIIRSGDVIPYVKDVLVGSVTGGKMPEVAYKWNETHVDILLENVEDNENVREKVITGFFKDIGVEHMGEGNVRRIMNAGFDRISDIIRMKPADFLQVEGFQEKMSKKIYDSIHQCLQRATLLNLMSASNVLGRGIGERKIAPILEAYPNIVTMSISKEEKVRKVMEVKGIAYKTAQLFVDRLNDFVTFLVECGLEYKLVEGSSGVDSKGVNKDHPLHNKSIVLSGFRNSHLDKLLSNIGCHLTNSISKNTFALVVKDISDTSSKIVTAKKLNIPIFTLESFLDMYMPGVSV